MSSFQLPASSFPLPASSFQLPASSFQLPASSFQLPAWNPSAQIAKNSTEPADSGRRIVNLFSKLEAGSWKLVADSAKPSLIHPFNPRPYPAQQFIRNRADRCGDFPDIERLGSLLADDYDLVAGCNVGAGDIDHRHIHTDRADNRCPATANQHVAEAGKPAIESVGVSRRHDGNSRRTIDHRVQTIARAFAWTKSLHVHDTAVE